ncbi:MAG: hypothetical protein E7589_02325 [Ruminococcaceae bacterium]|nr:hypothetical protein [Oscillospiraceae bacterium]
MNKHFITHRDYATVRFPTPWGDHGYAFGKYNCKELSLEPFGGLLTLKREFKIGKNLKRATVRATAIGVYDLFVNGERVFAEVVDGEKIYDEYKPGWTDPRSRAFADQYDITSLVREDNLFVAEVSPGWCCGRISYGFYDYPPCALSAEIILTYEDGEERIITGEDWQAAICGPVLRADLWDGEYYDARIPHASKNPNAHEWISASLYDGFAGQVVDRVGPSIRTNESLSRKPLTARVIDGTVDNGTDYGKVNVIRSAEGNGCDVQTLSAGQSVIYDMGQNMVGRPAIKLRAARGTRIHACVAEMLNDNGKASAGNDSAEGSLYMSNYRSALARIVYIASGDGEEVYFPTHAFYGFRYLEIEADGDVDILSVCGEVIGSQLDWVGNFVCDHEDINQLYSNVLWGMRGNYFSAPTDCPQRDERFGWTGDTQVFIGAASYLANVREFMRKWLGDMRDTQIDNDGAYCDVAPRMFAKPVNSGNSAWADAGLIVPYRMWVMYKDKSLIEEHFESMELYMDYIERNFGIKGAKACYGDWLAYDYTDNRYVATAYYVNDLRLMEKFCRILGRSERAEYYRNRTGEALAYFRDTYFKDGLPIYDTQAAYLMAIDFDLLEPDEIPAAAKRLEEKIIENGYRLSTGFLGTAILCRVLSRVGLTHLCYDLLLQTENPSWLYSVKQGATTIWERWNSYTIADGFGKVEMNSFNHYAYGAVAEWFYSGMCGILPDENNPAFSRFIIAPCPDMRTEDKLIGGQKNINSAAAEYKCDYGTIKSGWSRKDGKTTYTVTVPDGTVAEARFICKGDSLTLNGKVVTSTELCAHRDGARLCFELHAGEYTVVITD